MHKVAKKILDDIGYNSEDHKPEEEIEEKVYRKRYPGRD